MLRHKPITQSSLRDALAIGLADAQGSKSDPDIAAELGWSAQTVRNVRNRNNTLSLDLAFEADSRTNGLFLAPSHALYGRKSVPINAACDTDNTLPRCMTAALMKVVSALEDNGEIDDLELLHMPEIDALGDRLDALRERRRNIRKTGE